MLWGVGENKRAPCRNGKKSNGKELIAYRKQKGVIRT